MVWYQDPHSLKLFNALKEKERKEEKKEGKKMTFNYIYSFSLNIGLYIWLGSLLSFLIWAKLSRLLQ